MSKIIDFLVETLKKFGLPVTPARIYAILICIFAVVFACCAMGALPADTDDTLAEWIKKATGGVIDFTALAKETTGDDDPTSTPTPTPTPEPTATPVLATPILPESVSEPEIPEPIPETWGAHPLGWEPGDPLAYFE